MRQLRLPAWPVFRSCSSFSNRPNPIDVTSLKPPTRLECRRQDFTHHADVPKPQKIGALKPPLPAIETLVRELTDTDDQDLPSLKSTQGHERRIPVRIHLQQQRLEELSRTLAGQVVEGHWLSRLRSAPIIDQSLSRACRNRALGPVRSHGLWDLHLVDPLRAASCESASLGLGGLCR